MSEMTFYPVNMGGVCFEEYLQFLNRTINIGSLNMLDINILLFMCLLFVFRGKIGLLAILITVFRGNLFWSGVNDICVRVQPIV